MHQQPWQCTNQCAVFETIGTPTFCPHCGSRHVEPQADGLEVYDTFEETYINMTSDG